MGQSEKRQEILQHYNETHSKLCYTNTHIVILKIIIIWPWGFYFIITLYVVNS